MKTLSHDGKITKNGLDLLMTFNATCDLLSYAHSKNFQILLTEVGQNIPHLDVSMLANRSTLERNLDKHAKTLLDIDSIESYKNLILLFDKADYQ